MIILDVVAGDLIIYYVLYEKTCISLLSFSVCSSVVIDLYQLQRFGFSENILFISYFISVMSIMLF